jgi:uncharacterized protein (TIGR03437 family)
VTVQSTAAATGAVAPGSAATIYGPGLASNTIAAGSLPLSATLGGVSVTITDSTGKTFPTNLYYVSPQQINLVIPAGVAAGTATFTIVNGAATQYADAPVQPTAPSLFSANATGTGVAAATAIRVAGANPTAQSPVTVFNCDSSGCAGVPIELDASSTVVLTLYGTGIQNRSSLANVQATVNGINQTVLYAGPQGSYPGLDQVNVSLSSSLSGAGVANVVLTVDGQTSNTVTVTIQ